MTVYPKIKSIYFFLFTLTAVYESRVFWCWVFQMYFHGRFEQHRVPSSSILFQRRQTSVWPISLKLGKSLNASRWINSSTDMRIWFDLTLGWTFPVSFLSKTGEKRDVVIQATCNKTMCRLFSIVLSKNSLILKMFLGSKHNVAVTLLK